MSALATLAPALVLAAPLLLAALLVVPRLRAWVARAAPLAALPALALALAPAASAPLELPGLLLDVRLGAVDAVARGFLTFTAILWLVAAWSAHAYLGDHPRRAGFWAWFLLAMTGNLGVVLAGDQVSFYLWYAVMSLAAYGLVVHDRTDAARRAGKVYLIMALLGDVLVLAALLLASGGGDNLALAAVPAAVAASPHAGLIGLLLLAGFGVKVGAVLPLHVWLPLAHPVAPAPASALLSGAMIKAGLLGWLRFLPLGELAQPELGAAWIALGLTAAFHGAVVGVTQRDAKTVLAYSSISQMGLMMVGVGVALTAPAAAPIATLAVVAFAGHHALAKGLLFLATAVVGPGLGRLGRALMAAGLAWVALELVGAPLTGGAEAKHALAAVTAHGPRPAQVTALLSVAAIGTTLLMARTLWLLAARVREPASSAGPPPPGLWLPWAALVAADLALRLRDASLGPLLAPGALWKATWPLAAGLLVVAAAVALARRGARLPQVPAGDVLVGFAWLGARAAAFGRAVATRAERVDAGLRAHRARLDLGGRLARAGRALDRLDDGAARFGVVGLVLAALFGGLVALLAGGA